MVDMARLSRRTKPGAVAGEFDIGIGVEFTHRVLASICNPHHWESCAHGIQLKLVVIGRRMIDAGEQAQVEIGIKGVGLGAGKRSPRQRQGGDEAQSAAG